METFQFDLANLWLIIIGFILLLYVITDGFDLGVGMLTLLTGDEDQRGVMMASLGSVWHGNQTWLVVLGGMLFGAFPLFYGLVLSALYIPIVVMLFGLIFRGVAFEFRERSHCRRPWSLSFGLGSLVATLAQGFALGGLLSGLQVVGGVYTGGIWDWLNPYTALVAVGVISGYGLQGAAYLIVKTTGGLQQRSFAQARVAALLTLALGLAVYGWTARLHPYMAQKWLVLPDFYQVALFPLLAVGAFGMLLRGLWQGSERAPLLWSITLIVCAFAGVSVGLYPYMIPGPVTVAMAAASPKTLKFMIVVIGAFIPAMLVYNIYLYRVFRGKIPGQGYGEPGE